MPDISIKLDKLKQEDIVSMFEDVGKLVTQAVVLLILNHVINGDELLPEKSLFMLLHLVMGTIVFHLFIRLSIQQMINEKKDDQKTT